MKILKRLLEVIFMLLVVSFQCYYSFLILPVAFLVIPIQYIIKGKWHDSSNDWSDKMLHTTIFKDFLK